MCIHLTNGETEAGTGQWLLSDIPFQVSLTHSTGLLPPQDLLEQAHRLHPDPRPFMVNSHISVASFILNELDSLWPSTCLNIKSEWTLSSTTNGKHNGSGLRHSSLSDSLLRTSAISCQPGDRACLPSPGWGLAYQVGS